MNFIDFLEEGKINNKDLEFKDNRFIIGDKTYFFAEKKGKYINNVLDSERRPTDFRLYQFDKNKLPYRKLSCGMIQYILRLIVK